jgi:hypothetical protein
VLPELFNAHGLLPHGDYTVTFAELRESLLVKGVAPVRSTWDGPWRRHLVENLEILAEELWKAGIANIFVNGSFVEDEDHPNDIDGYFECDFEEFYTGRLANKLNRLSSHKVWTWEPDDRVVVKGAEGKKLPMWAVYRIELHPDFGFNVSGIRNAHGLRIPFSEAFRQHREDFKPKGIVKLVPTHPLGGTQR